MSLSQVITIRVPSDGLPSGEMSFTSFIPADKGPSGSGRTVAGGGGGEQSGTASGGGISGGASGSGGSGGGADAPSVAADAVFTTAGATATAASPSAPPPVALSSGPQQQPSQKAISYNAPPPDPLSHLSYISTNGAPSDSDASLQQYGSINYSAAGALVQSRIGQSSALQPAPIQGSSLLVAGPGSLCAALPRYVRQPPIESVVFGWGVSEDGQLGLAESGSDVAVPKVVEALLGVQFSGRGFCRTPLVAGSRNTLALDAAGQVWSFGWNDRGTLGHGHRERESKPQRVAALKGIRVVQVAIGGWHCLALSDRGTIFAWGGNEYAQCTGKVVLGERDVAEPQPIDLGLGQHQRVRQVAAGGMHSLALLEDGTVWQWGENWGDFSMAPVRTPRAVPGAVAVAAVSCGAFHNLMLTAGGRIMSWGMNDYGQLGNGSTTYATAPRPVVDLDNVVVADIAAGGWHSCALSSAGEVYVWGRGEYGRLGLGDRTGVSKLRPQKVRGLESHVVVQVAAGGSHTLALTSTARLFVWGRGAFGRLGLSEPRDSYHPVECWLPGGTERWRVAAIGAGGRHSMCLAIPVRDTGMGGPYDDEYETDGAAMGLPNPSGFRRVGSSEEYDIDGYSEPSLYDKDVLYRQVISRPQQLADAASLGRSRLGVVESTTDPAPAAAVWLAEGTAVSVSVDGSIPGGEVAAAEGGGRGSDGSIRTAKVGAGSDDVSRDGSDQAASLDLRPSTPHQDSGTTEWLPKDSVATTQLPTDSASTSTTIPHHLAHAPPAPPYLLGAAAHGAFTDPVIANSSLLASSSGAVPIPNTSSAGMTTMAAPHVVSGVWPSAAFPLSSSSSFRKSVEISAASAAAAASFGGRASSGTGFLPPVRVKPSSLATSSLSPGNSNPEAVAAAAAAASGGNGGSSGGADSPSRGTRGGDHLAPLPPAPLSSSYSMRRVGSALGSLSALSQILPEPAAEAAAAVLDAESDLGPPGRLAAAAAAVVAAGSRPGSAQGFTGAGVSRGNSVSGMTLAQTSRFRTVFGGGGEEEDEATQAAEAAEAAADNEGSREGTGHGGVGAGDRGTPTEPDDDTDDEQSLLYDSGGLLSHSHPRSPSLLSRPRSPQLPLSPRRHGSLNSRSGSAGGAIVDVRDISGGPVGSSRGGGAGSPGGAGPSGSSPTGRPGMTSYGSPRFGSSGMYM